MMVAAILGCVMSVVAVEYLNKPQKTSAETLANLPTGSSEYSLGRLDGYKYIRPIFLAEPKQETGYFNHLKSLIDKYVSDAKSKGDLVNASVYVKNFSNDDWTVYGKEALYHPGSLFKVITMIAFFRMAETNSTLLQKEIIYPANAIPAPAQTFESKRITPGTKYTIKDLIYHMIVNNDNDATMLLHKNIDNAVFTKTFQDLGLKKPASVPDMEYQLNVREYSRFVSVLYEGSYLTIPASEAAISLLCESDFAQGIKQKLPQDVIVAHKFGEAQYGNMMELHESAIVYLDDQPYLLTIMTKGSSSQKLANAMSDLSKLVYDEMLKHQM